MTLRTLASFVMILVPLWAHAQKGSATATARAAVILGLSVQGVEGLQLDEITAGQEKQVNLDGTAVGASVTGLERAGKFRITTQGSFMLQYSEVPVALTGPGGAQLPVNFFSGWSLLDAPPRLGANLVSVDGAKNAVFIANPKSDVYVFLGARVAPPVSQPEGMYETRIVLTATFGVD